MKDYWNVFKNSSFLVNIEKNGVSLDVVNGAHKAHYPIQVQNSSKIKKKKVEVFSCILLTVFLVHLNSYFGCQGLFPIVATNSHNNLSGCHGDIV